MDGTVGNERGKEGREQGLELCTKVIVFSWGENDMTFLPLLHFPLPDRCNTSRVSAFSLLYVANTTLSSSNQLADPFLNTSEPMLPFVRSAYIWYQP